MNIKKFILLIAPLLFLGVFKLQAQNRAGRIDTARALQNATPQQLQQSGTLAPSTRTGAEPTTLSTVERQNQSSTYLSIKKPLSADNKPLPADSIIFGSEFFSTTSLSFEPNLRIPTPSNYVLGPDDELIITVSGYQETNIRLTVQPEGTIFIPQVGTILVSGLPIETATARIKEKMAQTAYASLKSNLSKLTISLGKIKSIRVTIVGAAKPGNYTLSSLSTVFNSLIICGGPGLINTYRDIELIRGGKVYQKIDIYQFLTRGDQKGNVLLKEGDVINFPVYKKKVTVSGEVNRNGVFELKENENFENLLFFTGGYTAKAYKATIKVKQVTDTERRIKDLTKVEIMTYKPSNGDYFIVDTILDRVENFIRISGAVYRPGEFELIPGTTISSLIKRAGGLMENVFTERANLTRTHINGRTENLTFNVTSVMNGGADDIALIKRDVVSISALDQFVIPYTVSIDGEVRKPGIFTYSKNLTLKDILFKAGGFTDAASLFNIDVSRRTLRNSKVSIADSIATVYTLNVSNSLAIENDKFVLEPFDIITVRRNPGYIEQQQVTVNGEVNFPGPYIIQSKNERVSDILKRAGGLTPFAYTRGIYLTREVANPNVNVITDEQVGILKNNQNARDTSAKTLGRVNSRIAINFKKIIEDPTGVANYTLLDGDIIDVLKTDPLVKISGEVLLSTRTGYVKGKSLNYYIAQAGGTNYRARRSKIYVLYADGHVKRTNNGFIGLFRSYPKLEEGAEIVVPRKTETDGLKPSDILAFSTGLVSLVTLVLVGVTNIRK